MKPFLLRHLLALALAAFVNVCAAEAQAQAKTTLRALGIDPQSLVKAGGKVFSDCADCPAMVVVPAGSFDMGSRRIGQEHQDNERPLHRVNIKAFALGKTAVTLAQFASFVDATGYSAGSDCFKGGTDGNWRNTGFPQTASQPVVCVSWDDAKAYTAWLARKTGAPYRLPSEAEWEYAARAGSTTAYYWGDDIGHNNANCNGCGSPWDDKQTAPVGSFKPNAFGLYEMLGNAFQWTEDCYHDNYQGAPADGSAWSEDVCGRVVRGGSWYFVAKLARAAARYSYYSSKRFPFNGFRVARTLP